MRPACARLVRALGVLVCAGAAGPGSAAEAGAGFPAPIDTLRGVTEAFGGCWQPPEGLRGFERIEVTVRFSLRRDGSVIGEPRVTFTRGPVPERSRVLLTRSSIEAIRRCAPLSISAGLGAAIAGRPLAIRFVYSGPRGQGA